MSNIESDEIQLYDLSPVETSPNETPFEMIIRHMEKKFMEQDELADERAARQDAKIAKLEGIIRELTRSPAIAGTFPSYDEIQYLSVQIWHTPILTPQQKMGGHTHWSLKVECTWKNKRIPDIDISLREPPFFCNQLRSNGSPESIIQFAETKLPANALGGLVRIKAGIPGVPRAYVPEQAAMMLGHDTDDISRIQVAFELEGEKQIIVTDFRPSNGKKAGKSKYIGFWTPPKKKLSKKRDA